MKYTFGIIYTGNSDPRLRELTRSRSTAALPLGGRYRIIDVLLSNLVNAGAENVGIICQRNYHSLMDHLGNGKEWDLSRKRDGLFILPPFVSSENKGAYDDPLEAMRANITYLRRSSQKYVIFTGMDTLYNIDFQKVMDYHRAKNADITAVYRRETGAVIPNAEYLTYIDMDANRRITDVEIRPMMPHYRDSLLGILVMEKSLLLYLIDNALAHGETDFYRACLQRDLGQLRMFGYEHTGYSARILTDRDYFQANMDLLDSGIRHELLMGPRPVYTKVKDEVPAKYEGDSHASNSLVADGCVIAGTVENSVLFRGVQVGAGAVVRNSIVLQGCTIGSGGVLENVIADKSVHVRSGRRLIGTPDYPVIVGKNMTI